MTAFAAAINAIFADRNIGRDALYRSQGAGGGDPVRVVINKPDQFSEFNSGRFVVGTVTIDVRISEVSNPDKYDTFEILDSDGNSTGDIFEVTGQPTRDGERLVWKCEAAPQ